MKTSDILKKYSIRLKKSLSQNFLSNDRVAKMIVERTKVKKGDVVVEIGAGVGTLTLELAKTGALVYAYEIDDELRPVLEDRLSPFENVVLKFEDFLKSDLSEVPDGFKYVSNIPYGITGPIIEKILKENRFTEAYLMVQREVAQRIVSKPGKRSFGYMSAIVQTFCDVEKIMDVSRSNFVPNPEVDSTVVKLTWKGINVDFEPYSEFLSKLFMKKRKTIRNNLRSMFENPDEILKKLGIDPKIRPEDLRIDEILKLYEEVIS